MNEALQIKPLNSGSLWHRWEPHVHAPGTLLNNQFKGENSWEDYLAALEQGSGQNLGVGCLCYPEFF